jgi:ECF transporter S component (folate family)
MQKRTSTIRITIDASLISIYVVLTLLVLPIGGLKVTFEHFPVVLCAILYGPIDAMIVGGIGEFFNQMMTFGITPTTALWILPILFRGFVVGIVRNLFAKQMKPSMLIEKTVPWLFIAICIVSGVGSFLLNTYALYVDSRLFGYYSVALVFGSLAARIGLSIVSSTVIGIVTKPVIHALKRAGLI